MDTDVAANGTKIFGLFLIIGRVDWTGKKPNDTDIVRYVSSVVNTYNREGWLATPGLAFVMTQCGNKTTAWKFEAGQSRTIETKNERRYQTPLTNTWMYRSRLW